MLNDYIFLVIILQGMGMIEPEIRMENNMRLYHYDNG